MVARQCTSDGTPWTILSLYLQAHLKGSGRAKHYVGVGLVVKERMLPVDAIEPIHTILVSMIQAKMEDGHFVASLEDWHPSTALVDELKGLSVEPLQPGFEGLQPGIESARIIHSMQPQTIVSESQRLGDYRDYCAVFVVGSPGQPRKDKCHVRSQYNVGPWEEALAPPPPPFPSEAAPIMSMESFSFRDFRANATSDDGQSQRSPSLAMVSSGLEELDTKIANLGRRVYKLEERAAAEAKHKGLSTLEWVLIGILVAILAYLALTWRRESTSDPAPLPSLPEHSQPGPNSDRPTSGPGDTPDTETPGNTAPERQSEQNDAAGTDEAEPMLRGRSNRRRNADRTESDWFH